MRRFLGSTYGAVIIVAIFCISLNVLIWNQQLQQLETDRKASIAAAIQRNSNLVLAFEQYTIKTIQNADAILKIVRMEYENVGEKVNILDLTSRQLFNADYFNGIAIMDETGKMISSNVSYPLSHKLNFSDRGYFRHHLQNKDDQLFLSKPIVSRTINKPIIALSRRLQKPDGSFGGVVVVQVLPSTFTRLYEGAQTNPRDILSLISLDGITISRRTGSVDSFGEDISKSPLFSHVTNNLVDSYFAKDAIKGIPTFFSYRKMENYPIIVTAGVAEEDVLAGYYQRASRDRLYTTVISILLILFSILVCMGFLFRKKSLRKLKESEVKYRSMFQNSNDAILLLEPNGKIIDHNKAARQVFGLNADAGNELNFNQHTGRSSFDFTENLQGVESYNGEHTFTRTDGSVFNGEIASGLYDNCDGQPIIIAIIRDNSERKKMELKLVTERKKRHQMITRQVIMGQERVRETIGRELHDNVNQVLTTVKLYLDMISKDQKLYSQFLTKSMKLIDRSIQDIRNLSHDLSAPTLGTRSLIDSIVSLMENVKSSSGLHVHFSHHSFIESMDMDLKLAVYRIVQEQLNNIVKHADADNIWVILSQDDDKLELCIKDDGKGFDSNINRKGIGINNIFGRARAFEGIVDLESSTGNGCTLTISFPVSPVPENPALSTATSLEEL